MCLKLVGHTDRQVVTVEHHTTLVGCMRGVVTSFESYESDMCHKAEVITDVIDKARLETDTVGNSSF